MEDLSNLVVYNDGELELKVSVNSQTVWLNRNQLSELFGRDVKTIGKHINNVFVEKELEKFSTVANFATVQFEGEREVKRDVEYYNLDVIISVGYRVKSQKGVKFRQWATSILKSYIQNGYAINTHKITEQRLLSLENDVKILKSKIKDNKLEKDSGIFYDGQTYDSYKFVNDLLKLAQKEVILIDNYIDDTVFTLFSKYPNINFTIYTNTINKQLNLDFEKYSKQYKNITLKTFKNSHDRFMILDKKEIYHLGASLKDLGKKWFAFSKMSLDIDEVLQKLK
ncbi:virulence RhuM family protein [Aliarcobacter vitoriensis]|uniref:DNA-binding protein n=1 Tax=Aliarcobacter vitoriensis TaxID=2011099 RepID=A0A366MSD8_9BACT|nr:RhuM family protein [Aliarcobacter vitoriensis]RBQ28252.1 DNA-binding protein [Aliarcobacter vitoriensis]